MPRQAMLILVTAAVLTLCSLERAPASTRILYVDDDAVGADDGSSWADAFRYLQDVLAVTRKAESPVEIRIARGLYRPDQSRAEIPSSRVASRPAPVGRRQFAYTVSRLRRWGSLWHVRQVGLGPPA